MVGVAELENESFAPGVSVPLTVNSLGVDAVLAYVFVPANTASQRVRSWAEPYHDARLTRGGEEMQFQPQPVRHMF